MGLSGEPMESVGQQAFVEIGSRRRTRKQQGDGRLGAAGPRAANGRRPAGGDVWWSVDRVVEVRRRGGRTRAQAQAVEEARIRWRGQKRAVKVPGQETWVAKRVSAWPARSAEATILGKDRNRRGLTLWQASPSEKSGSKARLEQVLTRTQTGLTQGTKEEEEHRTGACSFGERQRWQQTGEAAQRSSSETDCRFAPVEFQQLRHALALRHVLRSRLKGSARLLVGRARAQRGWPSPPRASRWHRLVQKRRQSSGCGCGSTRAHANFTC
jgi:hypothetical protein